MASRPIPRPPTAAIGPAATGRSRLTPSREVRTLAAALAGPPADPHWRHRLNLHLAGLHSAFTAHMRLTEGPDGLYAELLADAPRLGRRVQILLREHVAVDAAFGALRRRVDLPESGAEELHGWAEALLADLARHRQRGADLLYQAYQTDIGGET